MCYCKRPNVNGTPGAYSWDGKSYMTYQPQPPLLAPGDVLLWDEPGRCGGLDAHSHHFRLVKGSYGHAILVRHGGGEERIGLETALRLLLPSLDGLPSDARYWLLHALYSTHRDATDRATQSQAALWRRAAAQKRIKIRKLRSRGLVKVWIEPEDQPAEGASDQIGPIRD